MKEKLTQINRKLEGSIFVGLTDKVITLKTPSGELIEISHDHAVWDYGDNSMSYFVVDGEELYWD